MFNILQTSFIKYIIFPCKVVSTYFYNNERLLFLFKKGNIYEQKKTWKLRFRSFCNWVRVYRDVHWIRDHGNENEIIALIRKAINNGVTFLDTAQIYGPNTNEILVGKAIKDYRDKVIIAIKFGFGENMQVNSNPDLIIKTIEDSLKRLDTDCVDIIYQHRVDPNVPIEEVAKVVKEFMDAKKVKY